MKVKVDQTVVEISDPAGKRVVVLRRTWREKIVRGHPEIKTYLTEVMRTVSDPDHVERDALDPDRARYYARARGPSRWLLVVVSYEQVPARVVSAVASREGPRSWST